LSQVQFLSLDGISFARPVPIGSILKLTSRILHTSERPSTREGYNQTLVVSKIYPEKKKRWLISELLKQHVGVRANVVNVGTGEEQNTNDFRFTWMGEHETSSLPRKVVFKTYKGKTEESQYPASPLT
jgi:acyl-coenzyme A thioesterase 9